MDVWSEWELKSSSDLNSQDGEQNLFKRDAGNGDFLINKSNKNVKSVSM